MQINYLRLIAMVLLVTQGLAARCVIAQTLQLPTFHYFAVETSVLVPDRGGAALGSVGRVSSAGSQIGPLRNSRASGGGVAVGGVSVHAFVHDFEALDQSVLAKAAQLQNGVKRQQDMFAKDENALILNRAADLLPSIAEIRRRQLADSNRERDETSGYLERARSAVAAGKPSVARVYFQMAERRASAALQARIRAEVATLPAATQAALRKGKY